MLCHLRARRECGRAFRGRDTGAAPAENVPGNDEFEVYFGTDKDALGLVETITDGSTVYDPFGVGDMDRAKWHYWRIDSNGVVGPVWNFATHIPGDIDIDGDTDIFLS